jgi:hypothetical protein
VVTSHPRHQLLNEFNLAQHQPLQLFAMPSLNHPNVTLWLLPSGPFWLMGFYSLTFKYQGFRKLFKSGNYNYFYQFSNVLNRVSAQI